VAILVESPGSADQRRAVPLGLIARLVLVRSPRSARRQREQRRGLSEALRATLVNAPPKRRAGACAISMARATGPPSGAWFWHGWQPAFHCEPSVTSCRLPGRHWPATGGILVAQALAGFARGYARADEAILWASSSEHGLRAAVRITPGKNGDKQWRAK